MPRSCPPLRSDEVGWHGRRVRTRLRLILERVFWFVNRCLSQMFVGVPDRGRGWRKGGVWEWVCSLISGVEVVSMPRPWAPAFAGETVVRGGAGCGCQTGVDSSTELRMTFGVRHDIWGVWNGRGKRIWRMLGGIVVDHDSRSARRFKWGSWMAKSQL